MIHVAIITLKTLSPLKVGSSKIDFLLDMPVNRDFNNLPFIQGTSIAGVLRKEFKQRADEIFGFESENEDEGQASKVVFSNALLVDENGDVHEKLLEEKTEFLKIFDNLPVREHTAVNHRGVAKKHSKYDEEVLYRGAKFRFMVEYEGDFEVFKEIFLKIKSPFFRLGGKTTNGFGRFEVESIKYESMDEKRYAEFNPSLNTKLANDFDEEKYTKDYYHFRLYLKPEGFFLFGNGEGDKTADLTALKEHVICDGKLEEAEIAVIPASSIKGAVSHRVAFYDNYYSGKWAEDVLKENKDYDKEENKAVQALFGSKKDGEEGQKGNVYIQEGYLRKYYEKVFNHVKIDRFTGGAIDTALFNEKAVRSDDEVIIDVFVKESVEEEYIKILKDVFDDIVTGMLPLGYGVNKGHGVFTGRWKEIK